MKKLVITAALIILVAPAVSQSLNSTELNQFKETYNNQSSEVPDFVGTIVGGERINMKLERNGTNETVGVAFEGVEISDINASGVEDPTMNIWTDQETVSTVLNSSSKYDTLQEKLEENEIEYETTNLGTSIKVTVLETLQDLADFFGLEF
jgi:hypothetical protein